MIIQERDRRILQYCYEHQFLVTEQISEIFFSKKKSREAYRRVRELEAAGFVRRERLSSLSNIQAVRVTRQGIEVAQAKSGLEIHQVKRLNLATLSHDMAVVEARAALSRIMAGQWLPEGYYKAGRHRLIPDGTLLRSDGKRVAFEVENSLKARERYGRLLQEYAVSSFWAVFYVATTAPIFEALKGYLARPPAALSLGMFYLEDLKRGSKTFWTPKEAT